MLNLKIALRQLRHQRAYSLINMLGLGISIGCCILIFLFVHAQLSVDTFHKNTDRIGRIVTDLNMEGMRQISGVPYPMADVLRSEISIVEKAAMTDECGDVLIEIENQQGDNSLKYKELNGVAFTESELFSILDFPLLSGDPAAIKEPNKAFLSEKTALKYFGTTNVIGRSFKAFNELEIQIVGVLRDMPANTDYGHNIFISWATLKNRPEKNDLTSWGGIRGGTHCFALLAKGHTINDLQSALPAFSKRHNHPERSDLFDYKAFSLPALHFDTRYGGAFEMRYIWALCLIAVFLLVTAAFNFINMATAQALTRVREVGIRKSMGGSKSQLFGQFMLETSLIMTAAGLIGMVTAFAFLPYLNQWTSQNLEVKLLDPVLIGFLLALGVVLTLLSGAYPGFVMARFKLIQSLKGIVDGGPTSAFSLRKTLVVGQFVISQLLIVVAGVVTLQLKYARDSDWGFRSESIVTIPVPESGKAAVLRQQLSEIPGIQQLSLCNTAPASDKNNRTGIQFDNREKEESWLVNYKTADVHYMETFGLTLVAGRSLNEGDSTQEFLVNETLVKKLNLATPEEILGKELNLGGTKGQVVGVLRDFHHESFQSAIPPITIQQDATHYNICALQLQSSNPEAALKAVERVWNGIFPAHYYEHQFLDAQLAAFYETELLMMRLVGLFAAIAIFVGCLGLYGLAAFMINRKTKEIGIRKTLGATTSEILLIFGKEYFRLILIAFALATPLSYKLMEHWLRQYAYHIEPGVGVFGMALSAICLVVLMTVGIQSLRAATANPVNSLRNTQ
jgi:putative ABC transport system permease protein